MPEAEDLQELLVPEYHGGIWGKTGSGKSRLADIVHEKLVDGPTIFMSPPQGWKDDYDIGGMSAWKGENPEEMRQMREGIREAIRQDRKVVYEASDSYKEEFRWMRKVAMSAARQYRQDVTIIVDEAHRVMPSDGDRENPLKVGLEEDRDEGLHYLLISQKPDKLNRDGITEIDKHVFFKLSEFARGLIDYLGLDYKGLREDLQEAGDYYFKVYDAGDGWVQMSGDSKFKLNLSSD